MIRRISQITVLFCFVFLMFLIFSKIHQNRPINPKLIVTNSTFDVFTKTHQNTPINSKFNVTNSTFEPFSTVTTPNITFELTTTRNPLNTTEFIDENRFIVNDLNFFSYGSEIEFDPDIDNFLITSGKFDEQVFTLFINKHNSNDPTLAAEKNSLRFTMIQHINACYVLNKGKASFLSLISFSTKTANKNIERWIARKSVKNQVYLSYEYNDTRFTKKNNEENCFALEKNFIELNKEYDPCNQPKKKRCVIQ